MFGKSMNDWFSRYLWPRTYWKLLEYSPKMKPYFYWLPHNIITRVSIWLLCFALSMSVEARGQPQLLVLRRQPSCLLKAMVSFLTAIHWLGYAAWPAASGNSPVPMSPVQAHATMPGSFWGSNLGPYACVASVLSTLWFVASGFSQPINCYFSYLSPFLIKYLCTWNVWQFLVPDVHNVTQHWLP